MSSGQMKNLVLNGLSLAVGVTGCLLLPAKPAVLMTLILLVIHSRISLPGEWRLIIQVTVIGWLYDAILLRSGVLGGLEQPAIWQLCLWALLATSLCHLLRGLQQWFFLSPLAGAVTGSLLYLLVTRLTVLEPLWVIPHFLMVIAASWALLLPLLVFIARRVQMPETVVI